MSHQGRFAFADEPEFAEAAARGKARRRREKARPLLGPRHEANLARWLGIMHACQDAIPYFRSLSPRRGD